MKNMLKTNKDFEKPKNTVKPVVVVLNVITYCTNCTIKIILTSKMGLTFLDGILENTMKN
jgi:hypothetical protein